MKTNMSKLGKYLGLVLLVIVTHGCLQEPAEVINKSSYSNKYISQNNRNTGVFQDEIVQNQNTSLNNQNVFDPYSDNYQEKDSDIKFGGEIEQDKQNPNNAEINWNNIFADETQNHKQNPAKEKKQANIKKEDSITEQIIKKNKQPQKIVKEEIKQPKKQPTPVAPTIKIGKPTQGQVISRYGKSSDGEFDDGTTFKVSDKKILATGDGKVIYVDGENSSRKSVIVKLNNGLVTSYSYRGDIKTALNREVKSGQIIGSVSDDSDALYFTVRNNGKTIDPESVMK
jgi:murein DD-endopeptidase MepM/ murein hydrolase activator NlpD